MTIPMRRWRDLIIALVMLVYAPFVGAKGQQDLLLFLSAGPAYNVVFPREGFDDKEFFADADILYSYLNGRFRLLAEYIISTEESELERFQLGMQIDKQMMGWLGRFHSPSRYWNYAYHHGKYLQTSISRPLTELFEDEGGVLQTHISGIMLETNHTLKNVAEIQLFASVGKASTLGDEQLEPFDLLDPSSDDEFSVDVRLAYLPDQFSENQFGLMLSWADLTIKDNQLAISQGLEHVGQFTSGVYVDWRFQGWRVLSSVVHIVNQMKKQSGSHRDSFYSGYLQAEYEFDQKWTVFSRFEDTANESNSDYLALFPHSVTERRMFGVRFDVAKRHALTVEVSHAENSLDDFGQLLLQWSAVYP